MKAAILLMIIAVLITSCSRDIEYKIEEVTADRIEMFPSSWFSADRYVFYFDDGRVIKFYGSDIDFTPTEGEEYVLTCQRYIGDVGWEPCGIEEKEASDDNSTGE